MQWTSNLFQKKKPAFAGFNLIRVITESLSIMDMPPLAGGIAAKKQNRLVFSLCFFERFAPRGPVNGVVGVLEQVWRGFVD
jgi:hypothetical protein